MKMNIPNENEEQQDDMNENPMDRLIRSLMYDLRLLEVDASMVQSLEAKVEIKRLIKEKRYELLGFIEALNNQARMEEERQKQV